MIRINGELSFHRCTQYTEYLINLIIVVGVGRVPLIRPGQKLGQIARLRNPTPYCSRTFIMTRTAIAYHKPSLPVRLFITTQQLSSWQHNSCICQQCLEIHDKGCFDLISLSCSNGYFARFNGFKLIRSSSNIIPIPSKLTPRSFRLIPNPSKLRDTIPKERFLETKNLILGGWLGGSLP